MANNRDLKNVAYTQPKVNRFDIMKGKPRGRRKTSTRTAPSNNVITVAFSNEDVELSDTDNYTLDLDGSADNRDSLSRSRRIRRPVTGSVKCQFCPFAVTKKKKQDWNVIFINYFAHMTNHNYVYKCSKCKLCSPSATQMKAHLLKYHDMTDLKNLKSNFEDCLKNSFVLFPKKLPFGLALNRCGNYAAEEGGVNEMVEKVMKLYEQGLTMTDACFNVIPMSRMDVAGYNAINEVAGKIECIKCGARTTNVEDMKLHQRCHISQMNEQSSDITYNILDSDGDLESFNNEQSHIIVVVQ